MHLIKALGMAGALTISAIVGGTLIGSALATDDAADADAAADTYCQTFMAAFADELGVTPDAVVAAGKAAANAAIDAAVAADDLSEDRATRLRERVAEADADGCGFFGHGFAPGFAPGFGHSFGHGAARGFVGGDVIEAAAEALGMESADLIERLGDAESLEAVAEAEGVAYDVVKTAVLAAVQADLDAAVGEGLDQDRADAMIERLTEWLDDGGELAGFGPGRGGHHRFGPWGDRDDTDTEEGSGA